MSESFAQQLVRQQHENPVEIAFTAPDGPNGDAPQPT